VRTFIAKSSSKCIACTRSIGKMMSPSIVWFTALDVLLVWHCSTNQTIVSTEDACLSSLKAMQTLHMHPVITHRAIPHYSVSS